MPVGHHGANERDLGAGPCRCLTAAVGARNDRIADQVRLHLDLAADLVVDDERAIIGHLEPNRRRLLVGSVVGWLSTLLVREGAQRRIFLSICAGMAGAFVGGLAWGLLVSSDISIGSLVASLIAAIIALAVANLSWRGSIR